MQFFIDWTWGDIALDEVGPGMFSWFHILSLVLMVLMTVVVCKLFATKHNASTDRKVVGVFALILVACELFKQQFWFVYYEYYRWEIFPFQFCSVPIYIPCSLRWFPVTGCGKFATVFLPSLASSVESL